MLSTVLALALGIAAPAPAIDAPTLQRLLNSPHEHSGDIEALRDDWWQILSSDPNSSAAQMVLLLWDQKLSLHPGSPITAAQWRALSDRTTENGWTHRMLSWRLSAALKSDGEFATADALGMTRGAPRNWIGIGPFGRRAAAALHRSYPPEIRFDPAAEYPGSDERSVAWRDITVAAGDTRLYPSAEWGKQGAMYYLRSRFSVDDTVRGVFQFASSGSYRVWLDGRNILTTDRSRELSTTAQRIGVELESGAHTLLVKCTGSEFAALLRSPTGFPIPLKDLDPRDDSPDAVSSVEAIESQRLVVDEWRRNRGSLSGLQLLAFAHAAAAERDSLAVHQALLDAPSDTHPVALAITATGLTPTIGYLPAEWRKSWLEERWQEAEAANPECVPVALFRAQELLRDDKSRECTDALDAILDRQPRSLAALLLRERVCEKYEWRKERRTGLEQLRNLAPNHTAVLARWLAFRSGQGRDDLRVPLIEQQMKRSPSLAVAGRLVTAYAVTGRRDDAVRTAGQFATLGGGSTRALELEYEEWKELGETDRASRCLEELRRRKPDSAALHRDAGDYYWKHNRLAEAARAYRTSLDVSPGQWRLLDRLAHLDKPGPLPSPGRLFEKYRHDSQGALKQAPPASRYPRAAATYLIDQMVTRIDRDGGGSELVHQLVRLDSDQAVEQFSTLSVPGEVLEIRVITPSGEELQPSSAGGGSGFTLPGLVPGSFVEYRSVSRFNIARARDLSIGPFYFRDPDFQAAFHLTEWIVIFPEDWEVEIDERNLTEQRSDRRDDGYRELRWTYREMEPALAEFRSPPGREILPNAAVRSPQDWDQVLEAVAAASARPDFVTPVTHSAAKELLEGVPDDARSRVLALYSAVCDRIKNTSGPSSPSGIWLERAGDRDMLLASLLRAADIPFQRVFAAARDDMNPYRDWAIPAMNAFGFTFLRVALDGDPLYLTTAFRLGKPGRIPRQFQGARALVAGAANAEWIEIPTQPIDGEARVLRSTLTLGDGTSVKAEGRVEFRLLSGSQLKEQLSNVSDFQRTSALEGFVRNTFRRSRVLGGSFPDLESRDEPFAIEFEAESPSPGILGTSEGRPVLQTIYTPSQLRAGFVRTSDRQFPYFSEVENLLLEENRVELGTHFKVHRLPSDVDLAGPWGTFQLTYHAVDNAVLVKRRLWLKPFVIPASQLAGFYDFCSTVDSKESQPLVLERVQKSD